MWYFINAWYCFHVYVVRQRLSKHIPTAMRKCVEASFSMWSVLCKGKVGDYFLVLRHQHHLFYKQDDTDKVI
jgi:hypothetical protein